MASSGEVGISLTKVGIALSLVFSSLRLVYNHLCFTLTSFQRRIQNEPSATDLSAHTIKSKRVRFKEVNEVRVFEIDPQDQMERRQHYRDIMKIVMLRRSIKYLLENGHDSVRTSNTPTTNTIFKAISTLNDYMQEITKTSTIISEAITKLNEYCRGTIDAPTASSKETMDSEITYHAKLLEEEICKDGGTNDSNDSVNFENQ